MASEGGQADAVLHPPGGSDGQGDDPGLRVEGTPPVDAAPTDREGGIERQFMAEWFPVPPS